MSARIMSRLACVVGIAICTFGYSRCTFVSGDGPPPSIPPTPTPVGNTFSILLTLHDFNGSQTTDFVAGETIRFDMEILNYSTETQTLHFPDAQIYDFNVVDAGTSSLRWRWSTDKDFTQAETEVTMLPNTSKRYVVTWDALRTDGSPLPPGRYVARGIIVADSVNDQAPAPNELASPSIDFTVH